MGLVTVKARERATKERGLLSMYAQAPLPGDRDLERLNKRDRREYRHEVERWREKERVVDQQEGRSP